MGDADRALWVKLAILSRLDVNLLNGNLALRLALLLNSWHRLLPHRLLFVVPVGSLGVAERPLLRDVLALWELVRGLRLFF